MIVTVTPDLEQGRRQTIVGLRLTVSEALHIADMLHYYEPHSGDSIREALKPYGHS
jgi:hypothetical protein